MIKLRDILTEADKIPAELYHSVTDDYVRDFVLKYGIKADDQNFVYLSEKPITRPPFKHTFKVKIPNPAELFDWKEMWEESPDKEYDESNPYFIYNNDIPRQYVKLI